MSFLDCWIVSIAQELGGDMPELVQGKINTSVRRGYSLKPGDIVRELQTQEDWEAVWKEFQSSRVRGRVHISHLWGYISSLLNERLKIEFPVPANRCVVYRFTEMQFLRPCPWEGQKRQTVTLREAFDVGYLDSAHVIHRVNVCFHYIPCVLKISSEGKKQIGLKEYLSVSKGEGGQIVGFQEHTPLNLDPARARGTIGTIFGAWDAFGGRTRPLFASTWSLDALAKSQGLKVQEIKISGSYTPSGTGRVRVSDSLHYERGVVKVFRAGRALPEPNLTEINLVGELEFPGYVILVEKSPCEEPSIERREISFRTDFPREYGREISLRDPSWYGLALHLLAMDATL